MPHYGGGGGDKEKGFFLQDTVKKSQWQFSEKRKGKNYMCTVYCIIRDTSNKNVICEEI